MPRAKPLPAPSLLAPGDHALMLIDFQPQMAFATKSIDPVALRNNVSILAQTAAGFGVSTILTTIEESFSGRIFDEPAIVAVKSRYVTPPHAAWTAVGVSRLVADAGITEIKVIARLPDAAA